MLKHKGKGRTFTHNLRLASLLSVVAGIVNITGLLAVNTLTTNVTGHFAFFSEQIFLHQYGKAWIFLLYILFFFLGAFTSSLVMEGLSRYSRRVATAFPIVAEIILLLSVAQCSPRLILEDFHLNVAVSCILLFAMGLQNALVTKVSQSVVRTTHLTGLFTDLGIELSHLLTRKDKGERARLSRSILLKGMIITCFFTGGIAGGVGYEHLALKTLYLAAALLVFTLWYDQLLFRYYSLKRKIFHTASIKPAK